MPSKQQVPFPFSVVPALGDDFGVSAPGLYAAIPFDPPCLVHLIHLHILLLGATGQVARGKDLSLCSRHLDQLAGTNYPSRFHRCLQL